MKFNFLKYSVEFLVIVSGVSASFLVDEYRESLRNDEERLKVLYNLKIELDEITNYCKERKRFFQQKAMGALHIVGGLLLIYATCLK